MRKLWVVAPLAVVLLIATPASAVDFNFHHKFKDKAKLPLGCLLSIESITKNYSPTIHNLRVTGGIKCKKSVTINQVDIAFIAHGAHDRHETKYSLTDARGRFSVHFALDAQCNRKWDGIWNHDFQKVSLSERATATRGRDYHAKGYQVLPFKC